MFLYCNNIVMPNYGASGLTQVLADYLDANNPQNTPIF
jgi:hypothetical protein